MSDAKFHGWAAFGPDSIEGNFKEWDYEPKPFDDDDIESEWQADPSVSSLQLTEASRHHLLWYLRFRHPHRQLWMG